MLLSKQSGRVSFFFKYLNLDVTWLNTAWFVLHYCGGEAVEGNNCIIFSLRLIKSTFK